MDHNDNLQPPFSGADHHVHRKNCLEIIKFRTFMGSTPYENQDEEVAQRHKVLVGLSSSMVTLWQLC